MEVKEKKSKKEIWKEISRDFWALCRELRLWWFSGEMNPAPKEKIQKKKIGMFYYAEDKSFSEELIPNKTVSGVVGYVDETGVHGLIVLLHQKLLFWANAGLFFDMPNGLSGKENTRLILNVAKDNWIAAEAAEYCAEYAVDGVKTGEAFLPSIDELKSLYGNKTLINAKLALIKGADLFNDWYYWSSSEFSVDYAWYQYFSTGFVGKNHHSKCSGGYVCPVVAF